MTTTQGAPVSRRTSRARLVARIAMAITAVALFVAAWVGDRFGADYVWAERLFGYWVILGGLACLAAGGLMVELLQPWRWLRVTLAFVLVAITLLSIPLFPLLADFTSSPEIEQATRPDGVATAVVTEGSWALDPIYVVTIRQNHGLSARQWEAGCLNGDDPADGYASMAWTGPHTLTVVTHGGTTLALETDPETGQPINWITSGYAICG